MVFQYCKWWWWWAGIQRFPGGPTFSRVGEGVKVVIPIHTHRTCDFPGVSEPPAPPPLIRAWFAHTSFQPQDVAWHSLHWCKFCWCKITMRQGPTILWLELRFWYQQMRQLGRCNVRQGVVCNWKRPCNIPNVGCEGSLHKIPYYLVAHIFLCPTLCMRRSQTNWFLEMLFCIFNASYQVGFYINKVEGFTTSWSLRVFPHTFSLKHMNKLEDLNPWSTHVTTLISLKKVKDNIGLIIEVYIVLLYMGVVVILHKLLNIHSISKFFTTIDLSPAFSKKRGGT